MTTPNQFEGLTIQGGLTDAGDQYVFGVMAGGVFVPLGGVKAGGFDQDLEEVKAAQDAQKVADHDAAQAGTTPADGSQTSQG